MNVSAQQRQILKTILARGRAAGASPKEIKAAVETAIVESNISNPSAMTDHDSQGWRQERKSLYPDPTNVAHSADRFFRETHAVKANYGSAGDLAAAVQRPAAQYRGRYQQHSTDAEGVLAQLGVRLGQKPATPGAASPAPATGTRTITTPGVDNSATRQALLKQYVLTRSDPNALLSLGAGLKGAQDTPTSSASVKTPSAQLTQRRTGTIAGGTDTGLTGKLKAAANKIDAQHLPYSWGGGHAAKTAPGAGVPLDCSGAISSVVGINPRVASEFKTFGSPGAAPGGKGVTIYASSGHVLMEIDGHFFGTSHSNPGGGAGWIPRAAISPEYLKGFTARHLAHAA